MIGRALLVAALVAALAATAGAATPPVPSVAAHPLATAITDPEAFEASDADASFAHTQAAGATYVRLILRWYQVAPQRPTDPTNPADGAYRWGGFDQQVKLAVAHHLEPIVTIEDAPGWVQGPAPTGLGPWVTHSLLAYWRVSPGELANFALAAATRYGGAFQGLPRVRFWQVWNEPNVSLYLNPQLASQLTKRPAYPFDPADVVSPDAYRDLVNSMYAAIHRVHADNVVVAGGLSPFSATKTLVAVGPLLFMRRLLCMSGGARPRPVCGRTIHFDVWSTHPYTTSGPTGHATLPDDVSIGDLSKMSSLLDAAVAAHRVVSARPVAFWVTEFGWDTTPPDCCAVPLALHARWVAEALYRMWLAGVSLVTWFEIRDQSRPGWPDAAILQSGLYFRGDTSSADRPKPSLQAFRFPFVAFSSPAGISVWGRTPWGAPGSVVVEESSAGGWKRVAGLRTDRYGIFETVVRSPYRGPLRARLVGGTTSSVPFSLRVPPDLHVNPFGGPVTCLTCG
jgi:hypothetical protein